MTTTYSSKKNKYVIKCAYSSMLEVYWMTQQKWAEFGLQSAQSLLQQGKIPYLMGNRNTPRVQGRVIQERPETRVIDSSQINFNKILRSVCICMNLKFFVIILSS